ncbi:MAG TPA: histidine kinase [Burkholderiales bacterium]|nr:histidine kinase [Burkholderiales bacterium]
MASINQNRYPNLLPNFRNLGVMLRLLVIVIAMTFVAAALKSSNWYDMLDQWLGISTLAQPMVILSLLLLALADRWLHKLDYPLAVAVIVAGELGVASLMVIASWAVFTPGTPGLARSWFFTAVATLLVLAYFNLRSRMLSPALTEARLQALQARIRPHFLFNSINAVLSLVRSEPRRAETALEDLADLFRVLMADNRDLVPLVREVELCHQYLGLEALRLGDRLRVEWQVDGMPGGALVPPLLLQPLLENAVYHGIEPSMEPGVISIHISNDRDRVHMLLRNPFRAEGSHHAGNKMALANIRERLSLHFDAEASLQTRTSDGHYEVRITLPYVKEG